MNESSANASATSANDDIIFNCPHCGKSLGIDARGAGYMIVCPDCKREVLVPESEGAETVVMDRGEDLLQTLRTRIERLEKQQAADQACFKRFADEIALIQSALDRINEIVEARIAGN